MSYLLDKSRRRKKNLNIALGVVLLILLFYFRAGLFNKLSRAGHAVFKPVLVIGGDVQEKTKELEIFFTSKSALRRENSDLKAKLDADNADRANYDSVVKENADLKALLGRKEIKNPTADMVLAAILSKPNQSIYDTLLLDAGSQAGIKKGDLVFAFGDIPIGRISEVYASSSTAVLFSNSGEKTDIIIAGQNAFMQITGRGGGNFEMVLPRDFAISKGDQAVLPGLIPYLVAIVETTISDPRDPSAKALLISPVNIQELKFVEILPS